MIQGKSRIWTDIFGLVRAGLELVRHVILHYCSVRSYCRGRRADQNDADNGNRKKIKWMTHDIMRMKSDKCKWEKITERNVDKISLASCRSYPMMSKYGVSIIQTVTT